MKLAVGMPVFQRAWCLPLWFDSLEAQHLAEKEDITLCFAYSEGNDNTYDILMERGNEYGNLMIYEFDQLPKYPDRMDMSRFTTLAQLRNALLDMVRETGADYFLSWDNDIIFEPHTLQNLFINKDAVGALMDMGGIDAQMHHPSVMQFPNGPGEVAFRMPWDTYPHNEPFQCDIIMAVKLMKKAVYENTEYRWNHVGEDIGWCHSAHEQGYERWLQPKARGIHLYDKDATLHILERYPNMKYPDIIEELRYWYAPSHLT